MMLPCVVLWLSAGLSFSVVAKDSSDPPTTTKAKTTKKSKSSKTTKKGREAKRAVSDSTWTAMVNKDIIVISEGREIRGRLAGHDSASVTLIESNGAISDLSKDGITEVRANLTRAEPPPRPEQAPREEQAGSSEPENQSSFRQKGGFLLFSPGIAAFPFSSPDLVFYRWGFSVGRFVPGQSSVFAYSSGFTFEHFMDRTRSTEIYYDPNYGIQESIPVTAWVHMIRALAEFRIGASGKRIFGYALLGVGGAVLHVTASADGAKASDSSIGATFPIGTGIQALFGERFVLGFEPRVVLDLFVGNGFASMFDARFMLGAKF